MIEIIIRNLISNAIKFSRSGDTITISAEVKGGNLFFRVTDTGVGMTKEQITRIQRKEGFTVPGTANEKGAGIGLTLVSEFTSMHQGNLQITSEPGRGSSFMVIIPSVN
jgi:signal transduction histidine kinase